MLGKQKNDAMKTTLDLPEGLVKQIKIRAVREGHKLKDTMAELLRRGLASAAVKEADDGGPVVARDKKTGLPDRIADVLSAQEADWHHGACR
jgi:plasmid stability protein